MSERIIDQAYRQLWQARQAHRPLREFVISRAELRRLVAEVDSLSQGNGAFILQTVPVHGDAPLRLFGLPVRISDGEPLTRADLPPEWPGHRKDRAG